MPDKERSSVTRIDDPQLYARIVCLVERVTGYREFEISPETSFYHDLGVEGMDGEELILEFSKEFSVDMTEFSFNDHFGPELPFIPPLWLYWLIFRRHLINEKGTAFKRIPLRVSDLYEAARVRKWNSLSGREAI